MKYRDVIFFTVCLSFFIILFIWMPYLNDNTGYPFISMGILSYSENGKYDIENYYSSKNDTSIIIGQNNDWVININNKLGKIQYVTVKVKLSVNGDLPNSENCTALLAPSIYDIPYLLDYNEEFFYKFSWSITNVTEKNNELIINQFVINGNRVMTNTELPITKFEGSSYAYARIVFELWRFDENLLDWSFIAINQPKPTSIWNKLFFKINALFFVSSMIILHYEF